jgi:MinD-like ATPase involved in chromosome partitioning or flagellar assembly/tetratricopeptide (TPR) repeat protein
MPDTPVDLPPQSRNGRIVTFYSYKGGTGRTMALANVAWILAANGYRVLVADWDLESPGLHRFFHPFLDEIDVRDASGIINLIRAYEWAANKLNGQEGAEKLISQYARIQPHALSLKWEFAAEGGLDFLSSGSQNRDYAAALASLDWDNFYHGLNGGEFIDALRADMKRYYDYVLIDSRTGLSDVADICTLQLPDVLVDCFTLSTQGIEGAAQVARLIEERKDRDIRILPVPMRVDPAEQEKAEIGRTVAAQLFAGLPAAMSAEQRRDYWAGVEVPYRAFYAYEETLAVFGDAPGSPTSLLSSFERIAAQIADGAVTRLPPMDEHLRIRTKPLFVRKPPRERDQIIVEFAPQDQVWGEWIAEVLQAGGVTVHQRRLDEPVTGDGEVLASARTLTVVSAAYVARHRVQPLRQGQAALAVYIAGTRSLPELSLASSAFLAGVPENEAVDQLHQLLGIAGAPAAGGSHGARIRYPGSEPKIDRAPNRNARFTGRESDLRKLREQLRDYGTAVVLPVVTLQGLGGVGKTQVALEYVHRFKSDYDLVWWLDCGQPQFIDASLADLGARMQDAFAITRAATANVEEATRQVLQLLGRGKAVQRWLLVFDNAEELEQVRRFMPTAGGGGDVLITSRNPAWKEETRSISVEVFTRAESVLHLRQRVPSITAKEADQVAEVLGDLPLAVATAGAWLAETSFTVSDYLHELERQAPRVLSVSRLTDYPQPVSKTWDVSLNHLQQRSGAAARLFELCSVMAPRIALELIYSPAMARVLEPLDPQLSEPMIIGTVVQEINKLALIKLDHTAGRMHVHRLVQAVVQDRTSPEDIASAQRDVHRILAAARPSGDGEDPDTWDSFRVIWPHLAPSQAMTSLDESVRQLFVDRVRYLWQRHDLERGSEVASEVQSAWRAMLAAGPEPKVAGPLRRQLLHLRFNLANILRDQARFQEARALDEAVLAEQREFLGADHPHTLMTAGSLAADLKALGRYREALKMDETTYPAWTKRYGEDYARTLSAANNLAVSCLLTGDVSRALRLDEDTLHRRDAALGPLHPRTIDSASRVARDLLEAGRYAEAAARMEAVRQSYIDANRADSLAALNAQVLLGIALRSKGAPEEAERHFAEAWDGLSRGFGRSSSEALACRLSHSVNRQAIEATSDAEAEIRQVLTLYQERLGLSHPHALVCMLNLASAQRTGEHYEVALQTVRSAAEGLQEVLGKEHPYTLAAMVVWGVLLADHGDLGQAEAVEAQAADDLERVLGRDHPDTLRCRANLLLTRHQREMPGAAAEREQAIDHLAALIGPDHPDIATLREERRLMRALDPQPF